MPRNVAGIYSLPPGTEAVDGELADPLSYNLVLNDFRIDANMVRPVGAGGTGASTLAGFATALGAVTNLNTLTGLLGRSANLSDLANVGTAQTNLGISALGKTRIAATAATTFTAGTDAQGQGPIGANDQSVIITTAAANPSGVTLPAWVAGDAGKRITIWNNGANLVNVYPATGMSINLGVVNSPAYIVPGYVATIDYVSATAVQVAVQPLSVESTSQANWNGGVLGAELLISPAKLKAALVALGGRALLASKTAAASASLVFTEVDHAKFRDYLFVLRGVKPATNSVDLQLEVSANGGTTWNPATYQYTIRSSIAGGAFTEIDGQVGTTWLLSDPNLSNASNAHGAYGEITINASTLAAERTRFRAHYNYDAPNAVDIVASGTTNDAAIHNAFRFSFTSGNIAVGQIEMWGIQ